MSLHTTSILFCLAIVTLGSGCTTIGPHLIRSSELGNEDKYQIVGALGTPICHFMRVHAVVIDGEDSEYDLSIVKLDERILPKPVSMQFYDRSYEVPDDEFALYKHVYGSETGSLSQATAVELRRGYVGKEYDLLVYETGSFGSPSPEEQPGDEVLLGQGEGFGFKTHIVIIKVLKEYPFVLPDISHPAYNATETESWKQLRAIHFPAHVVVISATEIEIEGVRCRLLGIKPPKDDGRLAAAKRLLELYVTSYDGYFGIYNEVDPVNDTDGVPLIWFHGNGNGGWAQEVLVQAGLVDVDYAGFESYSFTTAQKNGYKPKAWKKILADAIISHQQGQIPNVNFEWPEKK